MIWTKLWIVIAPSITSKCPLSAAAANGVSPLPEPSAWNMSETSSNESFESGSFKVIPCLRMLPAPAEVVRNLCVQAGTPKRKKGNWLRFVKKMKQSYA